MRMLANQSNRDRSANPSRFNVCTSRAPRYLDENGRWSNRHASYWKDAEGPAAALGHQIAARSGRLVGIIFMQAKNDTPLRNWITLWQEDEDIPLIYTVPGKSLAPGITRPDGIRGESTAVELSDWLDLGGVVEAVVK